MYLQCLYKKNHIIYSTENYLKKHIFLFSFAYMIYRVKTRFTKFLILKNMILTSLYQN